MDFGTIFSRWMATIKMRVPTLAEVLSNSKLDYNQWLLFEPRLVAVHPFSAMVNHVSGFDDFLEARKWITEDKLVGKTHADKTINMRRGMFYGEWNILLRLDYEYKGQK